MTVRAKKRLLRLLDGIIIIGVILSVAVGLLVLRAQKENSNRNHNDTIQAIQQIKNSEDLQSRIYICMLKVPQPQRTPNLETQCRKAASNQQKSAPGGDSSTIINQPTTPSSTTSVSATPSAPSQNLSTPAPAQTGGQSTSDSGSTGSQTTPPPSTGQSILNLIQSVPHTINQTLNSIL